MRAWLLSDRGLAAGIAVLTVLIAVLSVVTVGTVEQIQRSRVELCEQANVRHDETIRVLDEETAKLPARQRLRAERQRNGTVALIEALAPKRDCETLR